MGKLLLAIAVAAILQVADSASAQVYPSRQITMVVPYPAGGPADALARILAERMRLSLGQPVIVENVPGAGGTLGAGRVVRAAPDGYMAIVGDWNTHVVSGVMYPIEFDVLKDFEPVALLTSAPQLLVGKSAMPAKDLAELIRWLKANPDKASVATVGPGSGPHLSGILLQNMTGTRFQFVAHRGAAPAIQNLVGGHVDLLFIDASTALPYVRSGQIKAYAVTSKSRWATAPDIPPTDEAGAPGLYFSIWRGLWLPKGTPKDVIVKLNGAIVDAWADTAVRQRLTELGQEIPPREEQTPEALGAHHKAEIEKWWPIIKAANIKP